MDRKVRLFILFNPLAVDAYAGRVMTTNHADWVFGPFFRAFNSYLVLVVESPDVKNDSGSRFFGIPGFIYGFFDYFIRDSKFHRGGVSLSVQGLGFGYGSM